MEGRFSRGKSIKLIGIFTINYLLEKPMKVWDSTCEKSPVQLITFGCSFRKATINHRNG